MSATDIPYPPTPPGVPPDLARPAKDYRTRVLLVLASLLLFAFIYLGLVVGSAWLTYWCFASISSRHDVAAGRAVLQEAGRTDERLGRVFNDALQKRQQGAIDDARFLEILERDLVGPWRGQRLRLEQVRGLPGEEQALVRQYADSFRLQEESWTLFARAVREKDRQLAQEADVKGRASHELAKQFAAGADRYYRGRIPQRDESVGVKVIVGIVSGLLCLFLIKGFFKWRRADKAQRVEVTEAEQPVLFAFIRQLCRDTRAPLPHRVFLTPEVNASVFYHESLLSLVLPTPKNLVIGLGLVNQLNLSEFKAVLAHEFGHFSQSSMKLGGYVYMANRVIADLVFGRDWLDRLVAVLRGIDFRIAIFAWGFTGILWVLRKALQGLFRVITFADKALMRQMEFNADLVAVSVTGSDALVHGLARLDFAGDALGQAWSDLTAAADHRLYSRDLFYHQTRAAEFLRVLRKNPRLGEPPPLPEDPGAVVQVFAPEDTSVPKMWATHPPNHDREVNAKRHYLRSPIDERSPWVLFCDAEALREKITLRLYEAARPGEEVRPQAPEVVQAFIDDEHAETTYDPRYHGLYDNRYLTPGASVEDLMRTAEAEYPTAERLAEAHARLHGDELKARMEAHQARLEDYRRVAPLAQGAVELRGEDFQFRGARYRAADATGLLAQVQKELDEDYAWMGRLDRQALQVHHEMARQVGAEARQELEQRYRFHMTVQSMHGQVSADNEQMHLTLNQLAGRPELSQEEFAAAVSLFSSAHDALARLLQSAHELRLPPLKNMTAGEPLGPFLLGRPLVRGLSYDATHLDGDWINRFLGQVAEVLDKLRRIHFKSLGGILALQERVAGQWAARQGQG